MIDGGKKGYKPLIYAFPLATRSSDQTFQCGPYTIRISHTFDPDACVSEIDINHAGSSELRSPPSYLAPLYSVHQIRHFHWQQRRRCAPDFKAALAILSAPHENLIRIYIVRTRHTRNRRSWL